MLRPANEASCGQDVVQAAQMQTWVRFSDETCCCPHDGCAEADIAITLGTQVACLAYGLANCARGGAGQGSELSLWFRHSVKHTSLQAPS